MARVLLGEASEGGLLSAMAKIRKLFLSPPDVGLAEEQAIVRALRLGLGLARRTRN